jgi:hypothetical protein
MHKATNLKVLGLLFFSFCLLQVSYAQDKVDLKTAKNLVKVNKWQCDKLQKDGRELNVKGLVGIVTMEFSVFKERINKKMVDDNGKEKSKKVLEKTNVFKMEMGGNDRIFNYNVKNDSIQFIGLDGFNDFKVVRSEKEELVIEQELDDSLFRWTMLPAPKEKKK